MDIEIKVHRAQALVEAAIGLFALALVLSALCGFSVWILNGLELRRKLRADAGTEALNSAGDGAWARVSASKQLNFDGFAAEYVFGGKVINIREQIQLPATRE